MAIRTQENQFQPSGRPEKGLARLPTTNRQKEALQTLVIRHMPEAVAERLEHLAERAGMPLSTFPLRELTEAAKRADHASLPSSLASKLNQRSRILEALDACRDER